MKSPPVHLFVKFWSTSVLSMGSLIPLFLDFWCPGFESQGGFLTCMLPHLDAINSSDLPLLQHLLTFRWPALHLSHFDFYCPQRSWGKVIFSEACVKNSVHGGHVWQGACMAGGGMCGRGTCMAGACMAGGAHDRGHAWQGACMARGHVWQGVWVVGGMCGRGGVHATHAPSQTPRDMVSQCTGSTHPTGMHSCFTCICASIDGI